MYDILDKKDYRQENKIQKYLQHSESYSNQILYE